MTSQDQGKTEWAASLHALLMTMMSHPDYDARFILPYHIDTTLATWYLELRGQQSRLPYASLFELEEESRHRLRFSCAGVYAGPPQDLRYSNIRDRLDIHLESYTSLAQREERSRASTRRPPYTPTYRSGIVLAHGCISFINLVDFLTQVFAACYPGKFQIETTRQEKAQSLDYTTKCCFFSSGIQKHLSASTIVADELVLNKFQSLKKGLEPLAAHIDLFEIETFPAKQTQPLLMLQAKKLATFLKRTYTEAPPEGKEEILMACCSLLKEAYAEDAKTLTKLEHRLLAEGENTS